MLFFGRKTGHPAASAESARLTRRTAQFSLTVMPLPIPSMSRRAHLWSIFFAARLAVDCWAQLPIPSRPVSPTVEDKSFAFDPPTQIYHAKPGEQNITLTFRVTNISLETAVIKDVKTSCGCTVAKLPSKPWQVAPGASGDLELIIDLQGKSGTLIKTATIETLRGTRVLMFQVVLPELPPAPLDPNARERNMQLATANRQAVFVGDCARCHVAPTVGLIGKPLYQAACGICHESEHRATMVPDLAKLDHPTNRDFWLALIIAGKPGTLMPGFSADLGGPLSKSQIESIANYLAVTYPSRTPVSPGTATPVKSN